MAEDDPERVFRQTGWPGLRARLFHLYFVLRRPMTLGVRGLIHDRAANSIFLIRHTYVPGWQLPGGGVETGETMEEALAREVMEECNVALAASPRLISIHHNRGASKRDHVGFYLIEQFRQTTPKRPDHEIAEAGFFPLDALPDGITPATLRRIREVFEEAAVSPHW
jgi:ADP-ribose pyrophosphatase YjhB (NUDIX family)